MLIPTKDGLVDRNELIVTFDITENADAFVVTCKWNKDEEILRQDVWVNLKHGLPIGVQEGQLGG